MKPAVLAVSAAALLLSLTGCEQSGKGAADLPDLAAPSVLPRVPSPSPTPTPNDACVPLSPAMMQEIASRKLPEKYMEPLAGVAVKSSKHPGYYVMAVNFRYISAEEAAAKGMYSGKFVGAWASTSMTPGAPIYSMPGSSAELWTDWPDASQPPLNALIGRDDAEFVAVHCVTF